MICTNCGTRLEAGAEFCKTCGAPVSARPSSREIRARVQGGGRHAAPAGTGLPRLGIPSVSGDLAPLYCLGAALLSLLQLVYLFVKTLFVSFGSGQESFASVSFSVYGALRDGGPLFLGVLLVLLCLVLLGSVALPMLLRGRPSFWLSLGVSALLLILYLVALGRIRSAFDGSFLGIKPKLGFLGWMFLLNCLLIPALLFLAAAAAGPEPAAPARKPAAPRRVPAERPAASRKPGAQTQVRPAAPAKNVTPPDQETINALRRMAEMHRQGLVSDEEFARIKAECVARGWIRE